MKHQIMNSFRDHKPKRRKDRGICIHYKSYRDTLRADFHQRCGYCNDYDRLRIRSYTIDHFLPQDPAGCTHTIPANDYYNLVYACMHCNLAKSNKWPTNIPKEPNDGIIGFVDPEEAKYADLFDRNKYGEIIPRNNNLLGTYIIEEIKLWLPIHAKMWRFEKLKYYERRLNALPESKKSQAVKDKINDIARAISALIDDIFVENE